VQRTNEREPRLRRIGRLTAATPSVTARLGRPLAAPGSQAARWSASRSRGRARALWLSVAGRDKASWDDVLSDRPVEPGKQLVGLGKSIALDVARGLNFLHSRRIVHLDLKSPNVRKHDFLFKFNFLDLK
jgi:hypothetical protein